MGIVEAADLSKQYRMGNSVVRALEGITVSVRAGEFFGLLGTSGSGKSTFLNLVGGLDRPTSGRLSVHDRDLALMSRDDLSRHRRETVGMIFQSFNLIGTMTALENVALAMMFAGVHVRQREERAAEILASLGLGARLMHRPSELSGGEQQRVSIARALANDPAVLLADEPTGNLDSRTAREILELLAGLNAGRGKTVILVTHDAALAADYVRRAVRLHDGRLVDGGQA